MNYAPMERPEITNGATFKIKPPVIEDAIYITVNHVTMEDGTKRPIEVFINCKHMESAQWITALTRLLSASFRQPGPFPWYALQELRETFDPKGGYFIPGQSEMCPSIVAHIAGVIEEHCRGLN